MTFNFDELWRTCWEAWGSTNGGMEAADQVAVFHLQREVTKAFVPRAKFQNRADRLKDATAALNALQKDNARLTAALHHALRERNAERRLASDTTATLRFQLYDTEQQRDALRQELEAMRALLADMSTRSL